MTLSRRAEKYLGTLKRVTPVPTSTVKEALIRAGAPVHEAWVEFHERYAGYIEPLGNERAVYGLVHVDSEWLPPGEVSYEADGDEDFIACAEVHPSFDYTLRGDGEFLGIGGGGPCSSFNIKVEQAALIQRMMADGARLVTNFESRSRAFRAAVDAACQSEPDAVASDNYTRVYATPRILVFERDSGKTIWASHGGEW